MIKYILPALVALDMPCIKRQPKSSTGTPAHAFYIADDAETGVILTQMRYTPILYKTTTAYLTTFMYLQTNTQKNTIYILTYKHTRSMLNGTDFTTRGPGRLAVPK